MTEPAPPSVAAQLRAFVWFVLSFFGFIIGGWWLLGAATAHVPLWMCADQYVDAELEVTRFQPKPSPRGRGRTIEGVIHPGGERVTASTREIGVKQFVDPNDQPGRIVPRPDEIEGRRVAVLHLPRRADEVRTWESPAVLMPGANRNTGRAVVRSLLLGVASFAGMVFCFRRGWRYVRAANAEAFHQSPATPTWVGVTIILMYVVVLGLVAYLS